MYTETVFAVFASFADPDGSDAYCGPCVTLHKFCYVNTIVILSVLGLFFDIFSPFPWQYG
jgi:hypothetical protein